MAGKFFGLKVKDVRRETADCVSVAFAVPDALKDTFAHDAGQYITLRSVIDGEEVRRSYSICTSPEEEELRIAVKRVDSGRFSTYVHESLAVEEELEVMPPAGRFVIRPDPSLARDYLMIAAGSGITPIIALIKSVLHREPESRVTLLFANKTRSDVIFKEALSALKNRYLDRFAYFNFFSREKLDTPLMEGRIDGEKLRCVLQRIIDPRDLDEAFICGPETMMLELRALLLEAGLTSRQIHIELFGAQHKEKSVTRERQAPERAGHRSDAQVCHVTVKVDGGALEFDLHPEGDSVLDTALRYGADLPFACKGGVCTSCRAKVEHGSVTMDVNYGLEPEEVAAGFVLTCQSHPTSPELVVNYDIR